MSEQTRPYFDAFIHPMIYILGPKGSGKTTLANAVYSKLDLPAMRVSFSRPIYNFASHIVDKTPQWLLDNKNATITIPTTKETISVRELLQFAGDFLRAANPECIAAEVERLLVSYLKPQVIVNDDCRFWREITHPHRGNSHVFWITNPEAESDRRHSQHISETTITLAKLIKADFAPTLLSNDPRTTDISTLAKTVLFHVRAS